MSPQTEPHVVGVALSTEAARKGFTGNFTVRTQAPLRLGGRSKPEPDIAVVPGSLTHSLVQGTPTSAVLTIEVSDSTLWYDRNRKASAYAKHGIADYWILNLVKRQLEVRRDPVPDASHRYGFRYASITVLKPPARIAPLHAPGVEIAVADLLPWGGGPSKKP